MFVTTTRRPLDAMPACGISIICWMRPSMHGRSSRENGAITSSWLPACDVFEDKDAVKIVAELPGVNAEDVKISLENNVLTLRGEKKQEAEEKTERVHRYERSYGGFERTFALPSERRPGEDRGAYANGILTVTVPKAERARPREIPVKRLVALGEFRPLRSTTERHSGGMRIVHLWRRPVPLGRAPRTLIPCRWRQPPYRGGRGAGAVRAHSRRAERAARRTSMRPAAPRCCSRPAIAASSTGSGTTTTSVVPGVRARAGRS